LSPDPVEPGAYARAGVDIAAGERAVEAIGDMVRSTARPEVLGGIGGFAGLFSLDRSRYEDPVLVSSADGVGTKLLVAQAAGRYDTIGLDLVAMCVDDLVCTGAEPLFLLDYIATGEVDPNRVAKVVSGIARGCRIAGCSLIGGETAEHPDAMDPDALDLAGFAVGVVERQGILGPERVHAGDVLVGLASPGLRSNGYTLARHVLLAPGQVLDAPAWPGAGTSLAEELLRPSEIYAPAILDLIAALGTRVHACAHITGGGIAGNLVRILPTGIEARVRRAAWPVPRIFDEIAQRGPVSDEEMAGVFNLGLGMIVAVDAGAADEAVSVLVARGREAMVVGDVGTGDGGVVVA
jgi:phosphoribosylformylglycinamidine cyclo-ligase